MEQVIVSISDTLETGTGFSRVMSGILSSVDLPCYHISYGGLPSHRYHHVREFVERNPAPSSFLGQELFADIVSRLAESEKQIILLTLNDPWNFEWLVTQDTQFRNMRAFSCMSRCRDLIRWIAYVPVDSYIHERDYPHPLREVLEKVDKLIYMSKFGQEVVGLSGDVIPHFAFTTPTKVSKSELAENISKAMYGVNFKVHPDDILVLIVAANRRRKYWPLMLRSFSLFSKEVPARLIAVTTKKGDWDLRELSNQYGLKVVGYDRDPNVLFMRSVSDDMLNLLYNACDLVLLMSGGEGFGLPQLEAHAVGKPCVVGKFSASLEYAVDESELVEPLDFIEEEPYGFLRPVYRAKSVVESMFKAISSSKVIRERALYGSHFYSIHSFGQKWASLIKGVWG